MKKQCYYKNIILWSNKLQEKGGFFMAIGIIVAIVLVILFYVLPKLKLE